MSKEILGHIDCPHCGLTGGMRITTDKSGAPFGYCDGDCSGQMRVGGNAARVAKFYAKYPHIKRPGAAIEPAPAKPAPVEEKQATKEAPAPKKPARSATLTILESMAGGTA